MPDVRGMFDRIYIGVWDLDGKDRVVEIASVRAETLNNGKQKNKKPVIYFKGSKTGKGFALNKTNAKAIIGMYGPKTEDWIGKSITLYPTQASFGSETVDAIRVRPNIPRGRAEVLQERDPDPEQRAQQDRAAASAGVREPGDDHEEESRHVDP